MNFLLFVKKFVSRIKENYLILFCNLLVIFILFILSEYYCCYDTLNFKVDNIKNLFNYSKFCSFEEFVSKNNFILNKTVIKKTSKKPILLLGCSFAQGWKIPESMSPSQQISDITNRTVYNLSFGGGSIQHNYYRIMNDSFTNDINPEYIVYVFINDQIRRIYQYQFWGDKTIEYLRYKKIDDKFERIKPSFTFLWKFYTVKRIQEIICNFKVGNQDKSFEYFVSMMMKILSKTKEKWPDSKFIILVFPDFPTINNYDFYINNDWQIFKDNGIQVISTNELINEKEFNKDICTTADKNHPNELYWKIILPSFVNKVGIN